MLSETIELELPEADRQRGGSAFTETRSGAYYGKLGYLTGLGRSAVNIAEAMGDGIHPAYVRTLWRRWGLETAEARWSGAPYASGALHARLAR